MATQIRGRGAGATITGLDNVAKNLQLLPVELRNRYRQTAFRIVRSTVVPETKRLTPPYADRKLSRRTRSTGASRRSVRAAVNRKNGVHVAVGGARETKRSGWYIAFEIYGVPQYRRRKNPFPFVAARRHERYIVQEVRRVTREIEVELERALRGRTAMRRSTPPGGRVAAAAPRLGEAGHRAARNVLSRSNSRAIGKKPTQYGSAAAAENAAALKAQGRRIFGAD